MKRQIRSMRKRAFTLLEVLMVVVIIGLLAAFVVPNFFGVEKGQKIKLTQALVDNGVNGTLVLYRTAVGRFPTSDEGLKALMEPPSDEAEATKWKQGGGPWIKKPEDLKDAWGTDLQYQYPGRYNEGEDRYDLSSAGPNTQHGDDDDITNWKKAN